MSLHSNLCMLRDPDLKSLQALRQEAQFSSGIKDEKWPLFYSFYLISACASRSVIYFDRVASHRYKTSPWRTSGNATGERKSVRGLIHVNQALSCNLLVRQVKRLILKILYGRNRNCWILCFYLIILWWYYEKDENDAAQVPVNV